MDTTDAILAFLVAAAVTLALTPQAARLARRVGAVATPRERDLHERPTPRLGGIAILGGVLVAGLIFLPTSEETRGILIGAAIITVVGALDDIWDLAAPVKLPGSSRPRSCRSRRTCASRTSRCRSSARSTSARSAARR